jgi:hypothetical protein
MTDPNYTHLLLVVDRSGSMESIKHDMNGGIEKLLQDQAGQPGKLLVDAWVFDHQVQHIADSVPADSEYLRDLVDPRGMTALYDAIGTAVIDLGLSLDALDPKDRPGKVVTVIVTDGQENASHDFTQQSVKDLLEQQQDKYSWQVVFLGANIDTAAEGSKIGLRKSATRGYTASAAGVQDVFATTSSLLSGYRSGAAASLDYSGEPEPQP